MKHNTDSAAKNPAKIVLLSLFFTLIMTVALTIVSSKAAASSRVGVPDSVRNADSRVLFELGNDRMELEAEVFAQLKSIATEQAGIWGDTILEGDYQADGATRLDAVEGLYRGDRLLAYRIRYSESAWYTGDCNPGPRGRDLAGCQEGRISEASYVWPSLREWTVDDQSWAEFQR